MDTTTTTTTTTTTITYLGITATVQEWRAVRLSPHPDGTGLSASGWSGSEIDMELMLARGNVAGAPGWRVLSEFARVHLAATEARTASTAQARTADALKELAHVLGAESAEELVRRMPERLRPYAQEVLASRRR